MVDIDTGVGSAPTGRVIVRFPTTTGAFPTSTQPDAPSTPDTGIGSAPTGRADVFDEAPRPVVVSATGAAFTMSPGGPA